MRINCDHNKVVQPEEGSQYFREEIGLIMFSLLTDEPCDDEIKTVVSVDGFDWLVDLGRLHGQNYTVILELTVRIELCDVSWIDCKHRIAVYCLNSIMSTELWFNILG